MTCGAFLGDTSRKQSLVDRLTSHLAAGDLRPESVISWSGEVGSFSGCLSHAATPAGFEQETGLPGALSSVLDCLHAIEHTPQMPAGATGLAWIEGIAPGTDLSGVPARIAAWLFEDPETGLLVCVDDQVVTNAVADLISMHRGSIDGIDPTVSEWADMRKRLVAMSDGAKDREPPIGVALSAAEAIAWPMTDGSSSVAEALRIHANASVERVGNRVKAELGWSVADDAAIQDAFVRRAGGASTDADTDLLARLGELRAAFDARRGEVVAPYFTFLRQLADEASSRL